MRETRNKSSLKAFSLIWKLDWAFLTVTALSGVLRAVASYIPVFVLAGVLDGIVTRQGFTTVLFTAFIGLLIYFVLHEVQIQADKIRAVKAQYLSQYFETLVARKTLHMDYAQLEGPATMEMQSKIQADRSWGSGFFGITQKIYDIFLNLSGTIVSFIVIFPLFVFALQTGSVWLGGSLALVFAVSIACAFFFALWYGKRELDAMNKMTNTEMKSRFHYLNEGGGAISYREIKDILVYGATKLIRPSIESERSQVFLHTCGLSRLNALGGIIKGASSGFLLGMAYCVVTVCAILGEISIGLVTQYAQGIYQMANYFSSLLQVCAEFGVDAERLSSTMRYLETEDIHPQNGFGVPEAEPHTIEFRNVSFTYPGSSQKAIDNLNLTIRAGSRTAIVGLNGSGKTTLIKLLCRLYEPDEGSIEIDHVDVRQYDRESYQRLFSVVFQDFSLFSFPLGCIVASGERYNAERARNALYLAGFGGRLEQMELGLETILYKEYSNDGQEISGGEAQKVAIARAIYKDAPVVILDEPTAALDPLAEYEIYSRFSELIGEKGVIYISHRLSSCRFCEDIVVIEHGQVIEQGSHENLLAQRGRYAHLWSAQEQHYREE